MKYILVLMMLSFGIHVSAKTLAVDNQNASLSFSGEHAGMPFKGVFKRWSAKLNLPPTNEPSIVARFDTDSATTGDSLYDETLPEGDWFDVKNHPKATFKSTQITASNEGYVVQGELSIKGITQPVSFILRENGTSLTADFVIERLAFEIGMESDPEAEWVSKDIKMTLLIQQ